MGGALDLKAIEKPTFLLEQPTPQAQVSKNSTLLFTIKLFSVFTSLAVLLAGVSAQADGISAVALADPPFDSQVSAGVPFNITLRLFSHSTDFDIVALYIGEQIGGDPTNVELGEQLAIVPTPVFEDGQGELILNVPVTVQNPGSTNITAGAFYVVGAVKTPGSTVTKTRVQVV